MRVISANASRLDSVRRRHGGLKMVIIDARVCVCLYVYASVRVCV